MYAGKSTLVKLMVGELEPDQGLIERHPNLRVAYVAQHAFAHIGMYGPVFLWRACMYARPSTSIL